MNVFLCTLIVTTSPDASAAGSSAFVSAAGSSALVSVAVSAVSAAGSAVSVLPPQPTSNVAVIAPAKTRAKSFLIFISKNPPFSFLFYF